MTLQRQVVSGVRWTALENAVNVILSIASISILAKFLEPHDFGLMALAVVVLGFSQAFVDLGFSNAIIHKQALTHVQLSTLYWLNVLSGVVVFLIIIALSSVISGFYNEPGLVEVLSLAAVNFLILPFGQQFSALLRKDMCFQQVSKIGIVGRFSSFLVSAALAYYGAGVYALVISSLIGSALNTFLLVAAGLKIHRPGMRVQFSEVRDVFTFGAYQTAEKIVNYFNTNLDAILVGRVLGAGDLGLYSVAKQLTMRPSQFINPIVTRVSLPVMAKIQDDLPRLKSVYLRSINYLCSVNFPIYMMIIFFAKDITLLLLGERWLAVTAAIQLLSVYCAIRSTGNPVGGLLLAKGRAKLAFWWNVGILLVIPIVILIGSQWGIYGVSVSLVLMASALICPNWFFLVRPVCGARFFEYHRQIIVPALIAVVASALAFYACAELSNSWVRLIIGSLVCGVTLLILNCLFNRSFISTLLQFTLKKKASQLKMVD